MRIRIPKPPSHGPSTNAIVQEGTEVTLIWVFNPTGRVAIETQYKTAAGIQRTLGCSRATAYRIIAKQPKRYWLFDYTVEDEPTAFSCIPAEIAQEYSPQGVGNPNFTNGMYQQEIARRRSALHRIDKATN